MSKSMHVMRKIMLQLKTGYLKEEPQAYTFMKRYPPLRKRIENVQREKNEMDNPYLNLYSKAVEKNPLYADEKVYPAYWYHEPQALTLAKKQYELMQAGDDEDSAYSKAVQHVNEIESRSFEELKDLLNVVQSSSIRKPVTKEKDLADLITLWHKKLAVTPYSEMEKADQGEIDFIIQTKVLKWNEVERERRMKDPIFVMHFEKLRVAIFPELKALDKEKLGKRDEYKTNVLSFYNISRSSLRTTSPFYFDDYKILFEKLKTKPYLSKWSEDEREQLSKWIIDSLAIIEVLEKSRMSKVQKYLDLLRSQFFPMVRYPERAATFELPDADDMRRLLYTNDIGYREQEGKLFIRRAYRLPMLLFPQETFTSTLLSDVDKSRSILEDDGALLHEMTAAGLNAESLASVRAQLEVVLQQTADDEVSGVSSLSGGMDLNSLDALLRDYDAEQERTQRETVGEEQQTNVPSLEMEETLQDEDTVESKCTLEGLPPVSRESAPPGPQPTTVLERERDVYLQSLEYETWGEAVATGREMGFLRDRLDNQMLVRARCSVEYEEREAARRKREWERRGVWLKGFPTDPLSLE